MTTVREVFETNTSGVMPMTQAVLPAFRARRSGVIVNVTSSATLAPMPLAEAVQLFSRRKEVVRKLQAMHDAGLA